MSLEQNHKKIKPLIQSFSIIQILLTVYFFSHLYSLYNRGEDIEFIFNHFGVSFQSKDENKNNDNGQNVEQNFYITASINGTRYYYSHCAGINRINIENRIYFDSESSAEREGYTLAKNCKK